MKKTKRSGFTLIEMAVVVVIVGIIISILATVLPSLIQSAKIKKAQAILEKVDFALQGYSIANYRLPYADSGTDGDEDSGVYVGNLPYRTLGLSSGTDAWGNSIKYGVYQELTETDSSDFCSFLSGVTGYNLPTRIHTTNQSAQITNQAYILVSGGPKDLNENGVDGFFDGYNEGTDLQFDDPSRIEFHDTPVSSRYDDLMRAFSLTELTQKNCTGATITGPGGGGAVEICDDPGEADEDNDGYSNCADQDCYSHPDCFGGPPPDEVQINESPLDSGKVGGTYNDTVMATGGTPPYTWTLISSQLPGLSLGALSGNLTGTVDVCAGSYNVTVKVSDTAGNEDQHTFSITVENDDHIITPEPIGGTDFTCNTTACEYDFTVSGLKNGDYFEWSLLWQGTDPGGFQVERTGENTARVHKVGNVTEGSGIYPFQLKAWDTDCPDNEVTSSCCYLLEITVDGVGGPLTEKMEAQWFLDECDWNGTAGEVKDSGDNFLDGTARNGADTLGSGKVCKTGFFDGSNDYLDMGDILNGTLGTTSNAFTISAWIYPLSLGTDQTNHNTQNCFLAKASDGDNDNLEIGINADGRVHVYLDSQGKDEDADFGPSGAVELNTWNFIAVSYDNGTVTVMINGTRYEDISTWSGGGNMDDATGSPFTIGSSQHIDNYFHGKIDEVMVFSKALDADELQSLYAPLAHTCSGACYPGPVAEYQMENYPWGGADEEVIDSGSGGSNGKAAKKGSGALPTQTSPSGGRVCRAASFTKVDNNNGGYLDLGNPADGDLDPGTDPWTISAWIKWDGSTGDNIIYNKESLYEARVSGGYVNYAWRPHWAWDGGSSFPVTVDTWTYVTTVYDGTRQILYKNGAQVYSRPQTGAIGSNGNKLLIGARGSGNPYAFFGGQIDEVKIYNRALSEDEINTDMTETRDCATSGVFITTTSLPDGTINSPYSYNLAATGGTPPYGWEIIVPNPITGLSIVPNTGELNGTVNVCAGTYDMNIRVEDSVGSMDERIFTLTVVNGSLTVSPASPQTFNCTTSTFSQDFSVAGPLIGSLGGWTLSWLGTNPGGFEVAGTGGNTARFRKIGTSAAGDGYQFRLSAVDGTCNDNQVESGIYILNISGDGADVPYYQGITAEWHMDECTWNGTSGEVVDSSGNNNNGTSVNNAKTVSMGKICRAGSTDATSSYVLLSPVVDLDDNNWTISAWFEWPLSSFGSGWWTLTRGTNDHQILVNRGSNLLGTYDNKTGTGFHSSGFNMSTLGNGWHHLVAVGHDSQTDYYIDGSFKGSADYKSDTDIVTIGNYIGGSQNWGKFDEVIIWSRALDAGDVANVYSLSHTCPSIPCYSGSVAAWLMDETSWDGTGGEVLDAAGSAHGTAQNGATTTLDGPCYTGEFDGVDDHITIPAGAAALDVTGDITVALWFYPDNLDSNLMTNRFNFAGNEHGYHLQTKADGTVLWASHDATVNANTACIAHSTGTVTAGQWNYIAVVKADGSNTVKFYVNGLFAGMDTIQRAPIAYSSSYQNRWIGAGFDTYTYGGSYTFGNRQYTDGKIDEVVIWNRGLSESEIKDIYDAGRCE